MYLTIRMRIKWVIRIDNRFIKIGHVQDICQSAIFEYLQVRSMTFAR